ncbi:hypothetical protein PUNSTDRAFT_84186 [Punctularia strigosozonata HHB-11173 SS5]|uniref:uncharacterized protein n=1 Tax=Punctularia strigosozonata (strain HHB-11173) TaxID=741275 RepID=UPI0004416F04|nr:uncharacterized protein PUNSTDRAFT_84186 [Punctularia strigosozonata HHB-11173 SS5]EIN10268.1 hypothetical protein PUNSTDRAFT_84186 [Punctularia strigosozonata HHB-11173 SS5]
MDNFVDDLTPMDEVPLSYDDTTTYEDQVTNANSSLANRISKSRLYLLEESTLPRAAKRKRGGDEEGEEEVAEIEVDGDDDEDSVYRNNALLLQGTPIGSLPTSRLFAYATHFDAKPMGLEWVDDTTCVLVFASKAAARTAHRHLQKSAAEEDDDDGFVTAKPVPVTFWPPEEVINRTLGKGEGLKGVIRMRWARKDDVKKKGAKKTSQFYRKHGEKAGKEVWNPITGRVEAPPGDDNYSQKRRRRSSPLPGTAELDDDMDRFLAEGSPPPDEEIIEDESRPSGKMHADRLASNGKTLLERTSMMRAHSPSLTSRSVAPLPRRARRRDADMDPGSLEGRRGGEGRRSRGGRERGQRTAPRPKKSQQELDDELEAFLNERD